MERVAGIQQRVLARSRLKPIVERLGLAKGRRSVDDAISDIQENVTLEPLTLGITTVAATNTNKADQRPEQSTPDVPGFTVSYVASDPREAEEVCAQVTSMMVEEDLRLRRELARMTTDFLNRELDRVWRDLEEQEGKLADVKKQGAGRSAESSKGPSLDYDVARRFNNELRPNKIEAEPSNRLSLDHEVTLGFYRDLQAEKLDSEIHADMEEQQLSEQLRLVVPASLPDAPDFPNRALFAASGLGVGLVVGIGVWLWLWFKRVSQIPA